MIVGLSEAQVSLIVQMADATLRAMGLSNGPQPVREILSLLDHIQAAQSASEDTAHGA